MYFFIFLSFFFIENAVSELVPRLRRSLSMRSFVRSGSAVSGAQGSSFFRYWPVKLAGQAATSSGVPCATMLPPPAPPSGPRSMM